MVLCENYAAALGIPIVYAVFWKQFDAWTLNTPDTFRHCSSVRKLTIIDAIEHDCGSILGDVSYLMSQSLTRVSTYIKDGESESGVQHEDYGRLVSDLAILGENRIEMSSVESAAIDSVAMSRRSSIATESGRTELIEAPDGNHMLKLSSWITRHLSKFGETPTVQNAAVSAHIISGLMEKLRVELIHVMFPAEKSAELERLRTLFMGKT
jgi:hypothetical protein